MLKTGGWHHNRAVWARKRQFWCITDYQRLTLNRHFPDLRKDAFYTLKSILSHSKSNLFTL